MGAPVVLGSMDDVRAAQGVAQLLGRLWALADPGAEEVGYEHPGEAEPADRAGIEELLDGRQVLRKRFGKSGGTSSRVGVGTATRPVCRRSRSFQIAWIEGDHRMLSDGTPP